jgi:hypothetical protein
MSGLRLMGIYSFHVTNATEPVRKGTQALGRLPGERKRGPNGPISLKVENVQRIII